MINKYFFRAKISEEKFHIVLRLFSLDIEAEKVTEFTGLNRGTINSIYHKLRCLLQRFVSQRVRLRMAS